MMILPFRGSTKGGRHLGSGRERGWIFLRYRELIVRT